MFLKIKNRRNFFILVIILILAVAAVFFYFRQERKEEIGSPDDYVIIETEEGIIVKNEKAGLTMKAPDGWTVRKINVLEGSVVFYSPDAQGLNSDKIRPPLQQGCMIEVAVINEIMDFGAIKEKVEEIHKDFLMEKEDFTEIEIKGRKSLKNNFQCPLLGQGEAVYVPVDDYLYSFCIYSSSGQEDKEVCSKKLKDFLLESL